MRRLALPLLLAACADPSPAPLAPFAAIEASTARLESELIALRAGPGRHLRGALVSVPRGDDRAQRGLRWARSVRRDPAVGVDPGSVERVVARLLALGTAARPGPDDVASYLEQLRAAPSPLAGAVYMDIEVEDDGLRIEGSWRAEDDSMYPALRAQIASILSGELGSAGQQLEFRAEPFPSLRSDPDETERASVGLVEVVGESQLLALRGMHLFSGEDFALFLQRAPGAMFLIGVANAERGILGAPHFPDFDVDEAAIPLATQAMSWVVWRRLSGL